MPDPLSKFSAAQRNSLAAMMRSPEAFRAALKIDADGETVSLASKLDPWQRADFEALDPAWQRVAGAPNPPAGPSRAWLERPRGHSKTSDLAVMCAWALFASGRRLVGVAAAADKDQAGLLRDGIAKLVSLNPWLGEFIEVFRDRVVSQRTESTLTIISSDAATSYGLTPDFIIVDEVGHWSQDRELFDSLFSAAAKRANCLFLCITNAGFIDSWQWGVRERVRESRDWHFNRLDGPQASWITPARLDEQRALLPEPTFRRLWLNIWSSGSGDALRGDVIAAAVTLAGQAESKQDGFVYVAGVDLGLSRDASAVAVIGQRIDGGRLPNHLPDFAADPYLEGAGRLHLAALLLWQPGRGARVAVEEIERAIIDLQTRFELASVACDPWQARYLLERLQKAGVVTDAVDFVPQNLKSMATATVEAFTERNLDLFEHPALMRDLRSLRIAEKSYGIRLESPRGPHGHGDSATALSIALHAIRKYTWLPPAAMKAPLVCWP